MDVRDEMHSYAKAFDEQAAVMDEMIKEGEAQVGYPTKTHMLRPSKKSKTLASAGDKDVSNNTILEAIQRLERKQDETLKRIQVMEVTVKGITESIKEITSSLQSVNKDVEEIKSQVQNLQVKVTVLEKENVALSGKYNQLDAYRRRWNLRVAEVPERTGEDIKRIITDLLRQVSPAIADRLSLTLDVVHRLGPRSENPTAARKVIVQFLSWVDRDRVWRDAKTSEVLQNRNIRIFEDLTQQVKDARNKLWPTIEQARKDGKKAGFKGPYAYIEGVRVT